MARPDIDSRQHCYRRSGFQAETSALRSSLESLLWQSATSDQLRFADADAQALRIFGSEKADSAGKRHAPVEWQATREEILRELGVFKA